MGKERDISGLKFNKLTAIERVNPKRWVFSCECGKHKTISKWSVTSGHTKSCGCIQKQIMRELKTTHGKSLSSSHVSWSGMKTRCYNKNSSRYHTHGGRGINVCDRWLNSFENFLNDMGERPEGLSLDRIDNNGDYTPENCRWATAREQSNNTRSNRKLIYNKITMGIAEWAREFNLCPSFLLKNLNKRTPFHKILEKKGISYVCYF